MSNLFKAFVCIDINFKVHKNKFVIINMNKINGSELFVFVFLLVVLHVYLLREDGLLLSIKMLYDLTEFLL